MNTSSIYSQPRNKSMASAKFLKDRQQMTAEEYAERIGSPVPAWMSAAVEDIAKHIDMVYDAAKEHGVQLKWEQIEYGKTWEEICAIAKAKQSYKYTVGDYLPREAKRLDSREGSPDYFGNTETYQIRDYFGMFYIVIEDCVAGFYHDGNSVKPTRNSLTREDVFAIRFGSYDEAKFIFDQLA